MLEHGRGRPGDLVVIVAGSPPSTPGLDEHAAGAPARATGTTVGSSAGVEMRLGPAAGSRSSTAWCGCSTWSRSRWTSSAAAARRCRCSASSAGRWPGRRWSPPAGPCRRTGRCTRCTRTSCAPATRRSRSSTWSTGCATAARSPAGGSSRCSTARRSSACPRRSSGSRTGWTTRAPMPDAPGPGDAADAGRALRPVRRPARHAGPDPAADRPAVRRRTRRSSGGAAPGAGRAAYQGLDARRRRAAGRPAAARLRADLRQRLHPARLGADHPRAGLGRPT